MNLRFSNISKPKPEGDRQIPKGFAPLAELFCDFIRMGHGDAMQIVQPKFENMNEPNQRIAIGNLIGSKT